jgi:hypothetical protein
MTGGQYVAGQPLIKDELNYSLSTLPVAAGMRARGWLGNDCIR